MNAKISEMRTLSTEHRLQALSVAEIREAMEEFELKLARRHKFQGRKLKLGPILNAIVLEFMSLPDDEQEKVAVRGLVKLEVMLARDREEGREISAPRPASSEKPAKRKGSDGIKYEVTELGKPGAKDAPGQRPRRKTS